MRPGECKVGAGLLPLHLTQGAGFLASIAAISRSIRCTTCRASFQRRSKLAGHETICRIDRHRIAGADEASKRAGLCTEIDVKVDESGRSEVAKCGG